MMPFIFLIFMVLDHCGLQNMCVRIYAFFPYSKECNVFKTRAAKVQEDLTKALSGIEVVVNPDKVISLSANLRSIETYITCMQT